MEQETLFTASKWDILKMLADGSKSPMQMAKLSKTSVANISQQLRLLEMAGLVKSARISNRDKGQPRLLYSIVGNHSFLIASASDFVDKKLLSLSEYNKVILKIWFIDNASCHYFLEKSFWHVEPFLDEIKAILVNMETINSSELNICLVCISDAVQKHVANLSLKQAGMEKKINFSCLPLSSAKRVLGESKYYAIYDPSNAKKNFEIEEKTKKSSESGGGGSLEKR